jgi:hypothetical protein
MDEKGQLVNAVLESACGLPESGDRKQLTCVEAFKLAKSFEVEPIEIGRICNRHDIRICKCQLGCFK